MGEGGAADGVGSDAKRRRIASLDRRLGAGRRPGAPSPGAPAGARAGGAAPARGPAHARAPRAASRGPASRGAPDRAPPPRREPDVGSSPRADPHRSGARVTRGDVVGDPDASWYAPLDARALDAVTTSAGVPPETRERVRRLGDAADAETRREFVRGFLRDLATPAAAAKSKSLPGDAPAKTLAPDIHRVIRAKTEEKVLLLDAAEVRADAAEARAKEDAARARRRVGGGKGRGAALSAAARRRLGDPLALVGNPLLGNHEDDTPPVVGGKGSSRGASARNTPVGGDGAAAGRRRRNGSIARGAPRPGLFSALAPLRAAWAAYSRSAFPERKNAVTPSVDASACLGARVVVTSHADPTWTRVEGVLARVGAGAAFLVSEDDRVRAVPRRGAELEARLEGGRAVRVKYP